MPEEAQQEEVALPSRSGRRKMGPVVIAGAVLVLLLAVVAGVLLMGKKAPPQYTEQGGEEVHPREWLDIPQLKMKDVLLSIPLKRRTFPPDALCVTVFLCSGFLSCEIKRNIPVSTKPASPFSVTNFALPTRPPVVA